MRVFLGDRLPEVINETHNKMDSLLTRLALDIYSHFLTEMEYFSELFIPTIISQMLRKAMNYLSHF